MSDKSAILSFCCQSPVGLEPTASRLTVPRSSQLSYGDILIVTPFRSRHPAPPNSHPPPPPPNILPHSLFLSSLLHHFPSTFPHTPSFNQLRTPHPSLHAASGIKPSTDTSFLTVSAQFAFTRLIGCPKRETPHVPPSHTVPFPEPVCLFTTNISKLTQYLSRTQ